MHRALTALPLSEDGHALHKRAFRDALCFRYGWPPSLLPSHCIYGHNFTVEHAMSCPNGGFPSIRDNEIRDLTAKVLTETCHNVGIEPPLQSISDEHFRHKTADSENGARLDIAADNFWGNDRQRAFFDIRVFNQHAPSYRNKSPMQCYKLNEQEKKRAYEAPLVFSISGGMGPIATTVASLIAEKQNHPYSSTQFWLRCKLSFSLLRSAVMCIRGSRSSYHRPTNMFIEGIDLSCSCRKQDLQLNF